MNPGQTITLLNLSFLSDSTIRASFLLDQQVHEVTYELSDLTSPDSLGGRLHALLDTLTVCISEDILEAAAAVEDRLLQNMTFAAA